MRKLKILGPGCKNCERMAELVEEVANDLNIKYTLEKVEDINEIMGYGVVMTPALVVDGHVKVSGRVPSFDEIKGMLE